MSNAPHATTTASVAGFPEGAEGVAPPTNPEGTGGFLSDVIVELEFVDRETVEQAVEAAREPGRRVDLILLESGALTEEDLSRATAERYGFDHVDLAQFEVNMGAANLISRSTALRYRAVPIEIATDGALIVAVADPVDALGISDIEVMTKSEARKAVASGSAIDALAERLPEVGARQPAPNRHHSAGTVSLPPAPLSSSAPASEAPGDPRPANGGEAPSALEAELAEAHDRLREQADQAEAERGRLLEQVTEATQERDRLREAVEQVTQERDSLRDEGKRSGPEVNLLREQIVELEDADRRAEAARLALTELRQENEREREQSTRLERKLRDELTVAEERSAALAQRLSELTATAADAKAITHDLMALLGALTDDRASQGEAGPSAPSDID